MKVLVPLDGSSLSDGILAHVERVLLREQAQVHLLRVLPTDAEEPDLKAADRHLTSARETLEAHGEQPTSALERGDPAETIARVASEGDYDLIAMATHGRSGIARMIRGSVAERVLRHAEVPVYLATHKSLPRSTNSVNFQRVLIPLDGSKLAASILPLVLPIVQDSEAEVVLLHIDSPSKDSTHPVPEVAARKAQKRAESSLKDVHDKLEAAGVKTHVLGAYGDPAEQILDAVERQSADLLAMCSHGRTGLSRWRFGSVAEKVLREARCPLLVKTAPAKKS